MIPEKPRPNALAIANSPTSFWVSRKAPVASICSADPATVLAEQAIRDQRDSEREHSPLQAAADAVEIDTTDLTRDEVVARIVELLAARRPR